MWEIEGVAKAVTETERTALLAQLDGYEFITSSYLWPQHHYGTFRPSYFLFKGIRFGVDICRSTAFEAQQTVHTFLKRPGFGIDELDSIHDRDRFRPRRP